MADDDQVRVGFKFDGVRYEFALSLGEIEEIEDAFDRPLSQVSLERSKAVMLLIAFALRRADRTRGLQEILAELRSQDAADVFERFEELDEAKNGSGVERPQGRAKTAKSA